MLAVRPLWMPFPNSKDVYTYRYRGWKFPTLGFVLVGHEEIATASGEDASVRDIGLLESALNAPVDSAGNEDAYHTFFEKTAALGFRVCRNHAFVDANKRTSLYVITQVLEWNGYYLKWSVETEVMVIRLLGAGHLDIPGLRFALLVGCELDVGDHTL